LRFTNTIKIASIAVATLLLATACSSGGGSAPASPAPTAATVDLVKAAQAEGELVIYLNGTESNLKDWTDPFTKKYGVTVKLLRLSGGPLFQRFSQESAAGQKQSDILSLTDKAPMDEAVENGWLAKYVPKDGGLYPADRVREGYYYPVQNLFYQTLVYNTDKVTATEVSQLRANPMKALQDPRFKGRIAVNPPETSQQVSALWYLFAEGPGADEFGWSALEKVAANKPGFFSSASLSTKVIAGEYAIGFGITDSLISTAVLEGAPVGFAYPTPTTGGAFSVGISANAPHPNAARLFMDWATTPEASAAYADITQGKPVNSKVKDSRKILETDWYKNPIEDKVWYGWTDDKTFLKAASKDGDFLTRWNEAFGYSG
jgi:iron(III) transport system substrate-binding protein